MSPRRQRRLIPLALLLLALPVTAEEDVTAQVTYVAADGAYIDAGGDAGIRTGDVARLYRDGAEVGRAEVVAVAPGSARLRSLAGEQPQAGDEARFEAVGGRREADSPEEGKRATEQEPFVPLLDRSKRLAEATSRNNVSHGWISLNQVLQLEAQEAPAYRRTGLSSGGTIERLLGRRWSLSWSGTLSVRGDDAFEGSDLEDVRFDLYELDLRMRMAGDAVLHLGRFLPRALPAAGRLDGALFETSGEGLRAGAALGYRPRRDDLAPSTDEPTALVYATLARGTRGERHYSGTFGLLASLYDGDLDRVAVLVEQHVQTNRLSAHASAEVDLDAGGFATREGARLTRADLYANARLTDGTTLRAGLDHWEQLDTAAERNRGDPDLFLVDVGFWRYFVGTRHRLGGGFGVDTELAVVDGPSSGDSLRWRVSLSKSGILSSASSSVTLTVYNVEGEFTKGIGGLLSAFVPALENRLLLQPSVGFRNYEDNGGTVIDARLFLEYLFSERWRGHFGVTQLIGDTPEATTLEFGVRYRW